MKLETLRDLYIEQLEDLYDAEQQLTKALPKMAKTAHNAKLKSAFENHLRQTEGHVQRLEQAFGLLNMKAKAKTCKAMKGLVEEGNEMVKENADADVKDAGLIAAAQRVEHYEIAAYGTVRTYAQLLGQREAVQLLQQTLDEEGEADKLLTQLAMTGINLDAASGTNPNR